MPDNSFFQLICSALPRGFDTASLRKCCEEKLWQTHPQVAAGIALGKCRTINWQAYLEVNRDVKESRISPMLHFIKHGLFEGRKLYTFNEVCKIETGGPCEASPNVSVVVPVHNHSVFIGKGLDTLVNQTMTNIEIIVIDDCSEDDSLQVAKNMAAKDSRIRIIALKSHMSQHMARGTGIKMALGKYIMFMDADDMYALNACELAYNTAIKGYDIVAFNSVLLTSRYNTAQEIDKFTRYLNRGQAGAWTGTNVMNVIYDSEQVSDVLWNKIYKSDMCKYAFAQMADGFFAKNEDIYEAFVLTSQAKSLAKIDDKLYCYRLPSRFSQKMRQDRSSAKTATCGSLWRPFKAYLKHSGLNSHVSTFINRFMANDVQEWLKLSEPEMVTRYFNRMAYNYGILEVIGFIMCKYFNDWQKIAQIFRNYLPAGKADGPHLKKIGILYTAYAFGGTERIVLNMAKMFIERGHEVTMFLQRHHENEQTLPSTLKTVYVPLEYYGTDQMKSHLGALDRVLRQSQVDVMLCPSCWEQALLWQIMLMKYYSIPVILQNHVPFYDRLISRDKTYSLRHHDSVLACADKVVCLSHYSEIYNHVRGINARYVANPVYESRQTTSDYETRKKNIIVFGQIGQEIKRVRDACKAIYEIVKIMPDIKATFIGPLRSAEERDNFYNLVRHLEIENNVHVTGWLNDPWPFVREAGLLLSAAYEEAFPMTVCEAQSMGVPCVMYNLPMMPAVNNPAIVRVPHGDYQSLAKEALAILGDRVKWEYLSKTAIERMKQYSPDKFINEMLRIITMYQKQSDITFYSPEEYREVIRTLSFYAADPPPWFEGK